MSEWFSFTRLFRVVFANFKFDKIVSTQEPDSLDAVVDEKLGTIMVSESTTEHPLESQDNCPRELLRDDQWTLASILWVTTAVALVLAYAMKLGTAAVWQAVFYAGCVVVCGLSIGTFRRDWKNAMFWSALYSLLAYLAVAGGNLPHLSIALGWGLVGALVGSCVGVDLPKNWILATVVSALLGWLAMAFLVLSMKQSITGLVAFDTVVAGFVGGLLKPFTLVLKWLEQQSRQPRYVLASWLAICVLIGNFLVPILGGVQR